jgi:integrase
VDLQFSTSLGPAPTFETAARHYHSDIIDGFRNTKHCQQWLRTLEEYAFPAIGKVRIDTLDPSSFSTCLKPVWLSKPVTARRIKQRCEAIMKWSMALGYTSTNPLLNVERLLPKQPHRRRRTCHFPALRWKEIPTLISDLLHRHSGQTHYVMLELAILTACRSGEIRGMQWEDLDFDQKIFTIPASRMKAGVAHRVPLTPRVLELLKAWLNQSKDRSGLVFQSRSGTEVCDHALTKVLRQNKIPSDVENRFATTHGFRSSFRDWASENGHSSDLAERTLAHTTRSVVEAAYHRTDLLEQRRNMMVEWEKFCLGCSEDHRPANPKEGQIDAEKLLRDAAAFRQAQDIRAYVSEVRYRASTEGNDAVIDDLSRWSRWALGQADQLDPIGVKRFAPRD